MKRIILAGLFSAAVSFAGAQNQFNGQNIYVTGQNPPLDGFSPTTSAALQLMNDGTNGDAVTSDGIWSRDVAITSNSAMTLNQQRLWKMAGPGFSPEFPPGVNSYLRYRIGTTKFLFNSNPQGDGYIPEPNGTSVLGFVYTSPSPTLGTDVVRATGAFLSELGGADWDTNDNRGLMNDAGTSGDLVAADGIYTLSFTNVLAGSYDYKISFNGSFAMQISTNGYSDNGGNLNFNVLAVTDQIKVLFDSNKGRTKVTNSNPLVNPGPPFFATSPAWSTGLTSVTQMYDNGTNGDVVSGDGIHSRIVTVSAGQSTTVNVKQGVGAQYPGTGGYPVDVTTGQLVLVHFDTNVRSDGYSPDTRYVWTDPNSRHVAVPNIVGAVQDELGGTEWDPTNANFTLVDTGATGDLSAGDKLFGLNFTAFLPITAQNWKGCVIGGYEYQFGCPGAGYTRGGSNPEIPFTSAAGTVNFQIDAITGRIAAFANAVTPTAPFRAAFLNNVPSAGVNDWSMY